MASSDYSVVKMSDLINFFKKILHKNQLNYQLKYD